MATSDDRDERSRLADEGLARVREAGEYLGISRSKVYQLMDSGQLSYVKLGRSRRIPRQALRTLVCQNLVGSQP